MGRTSMSTKDKADPRRRWAEAVARSLVENGACERLEDGEKGKILLRRADRFIYIRLSFAPARRLSARIEISLEGYRTVARGQSPGQGDRVGRLTRKKQSIVLEAKEGQPVSLLAGFKHRRLDTTARIMGDLADIVEELDKALKGARRQFNRCAK